MPLSRLLPVLAVTLIGFASNSLLARSALETGATDAVTFTALRLVSGALVLAGLAAARGAGRGHGSWGAASALFVYAIAFSASYVRIPAGVGALILFGGVQLTMIGWGIRKGERPGARQWAGLALAGAGMIGLARPGLTAPDAIGAVLMLAAGVAWGVYSLVGRGAADAVGATAGNFLRASVPALAALAVGGLANGPLRATTTGVGLAVASGAVASGLGYTLWYLALPHLSRVRAAVVQLAVPVVAGAGAVILLDEPVTARLLLTGAAILGGVVLAMRR